MRTKKQLRSQVAVAIGIATLVGSSGFAESRHGNETRSRDAVRGAIRRDGGGVSTESRRGDGSANRPTTRDAAVDRAPSRSSEQGSGRIERRGAGERGDTPSTYTERSRPSGSGDNWRDESRSSRDRSYGRDSGALGRTDASRRGDRSYDRDRYDRDRSYGRSERYHGRSDHRYGRSYGNRTPYYAHGRVSRIHRHGHGYRIWIGGARYPFFVPEAYYHRHRFRVGVTIRLGGFYNSLGYYDYYDGYDRYDRSTSVGGLRGVVESVDHRRDTFVLRNDATGSFVTVVARDRRRVFPGDYVEVAGEWSRSGLFQAYDVDLLDSGR